jgi:catechol 2,3-dioxygenase-like lactoylglutathione lyase family enzyme
MGFALLLAKRAAGGCMLSQPAARTGAERLGKTDRGSAMSDASPPRPAGSHKPTRLTPRDPTRLTGKITTATLPKFDESVVRPAYLAHVVLNTCNMEKMSIWWRAVLGGESTYTAQGVEVMGPGNTALEMNADFITFDREHHRIALSNVRPVSQDAADGARQSAPVAESAVPARTPLNHIAFTYASAADLIATYRRLKKVGIVAARTIHHGPTVSNYYYDPDGNRVELQIDAFESLEALDAWFKTGDFDRNPIGLTFDFNTFIERFEAGDSESYLRSPSGFIKQYADPEQ